MNEVTRRHYLKKKNKGAEGTKDKHPVDSGC